MSKMNRRKFLKHSIAAGSAVAIGGIASCSEQTVAAPTQVVAAGTGKVIGANNRLRIAVAGLHGRGKSHIKGWLKEKNVEIAYLIDPDATVLEDSMRSLKGKVEGKFNCKGIADIREALDDKNLDAISIAAPNHWHSLMTIWAAQAGKHVYVEKPMSHDIREGRIAVAAQKKYGVVVQHGTQRRSDAKIAGLTQLIKDRKFGKLKISYGYCCKPRQGIGFKIPSPPPNNLDWNLWRGPAIIDQYHGNYVHYNWHWFWESGNGDMNNQGTHQLDVANWALDEGMTHPIRVMALGGRFLWDDQGETPNTMFAIAEYPNGQQVMFNVRNVNYSGYVRQVENEYYFEDGGKIIRNQYYPKGSDKGEKIDIPDGKVTEGGCWGSFIAACRAGDPKMANGNVMDAHKGCVMGHLMNNSYRLGRPVPFGETAELLSDNPDAVEHFEKLHAIMRDGVGLEDHDFSFTVGPWLTFDPKTERHTGEYAKEANELLKNCNRTGFEVPDIKDV
ncbi:MAG: gfo/Idh/MocA family oxidoreductase [Planctomycetota bacterium]|nr:MAG: gfo/Idh/MocA family oxidoreductase [Planctomycetota bacterium]